MSHSPYCNSKSRGTLRLVVLKPINIPSIILLVKRLGTRVTTLGKAVSKVILLTFCKDISKSLGGPTLISKSP